MWIFAKNSFISCVEHRDRPNDVLVRARRRQDLICMFPQEEEQIAVTPEADYKYRLTVSKKELAKVLTDYVMNQITYDNFKSAQEPGNQPWHDFLMKVWAAGHHIQK